MLRPLTDRIDILIVEDERVTAWDLQEALESLGYQVCGNTGSGREAIALAAANRPNLVMMDIGLSDDVDGITAAARIRQDFGIPVIYLMAYADDHILERVLVTEPFGYLIKPFNTVELRTTIEIALHRYRLERQLDESQQWFSITLNSLADGAIATDASGCIQFINSAAEEMTGWSVADAIGQTATNVLKLIDPTTREPIPDPFSQAMAQQSRIRLPNQCILIAKDGSDRFIGDSMAPILSSSRELLGSILIFQDITERVRAEQTAQRRAEREQLLRLIIQHIRQSLDLDEILSTTVREVRDLLGVERVVIYKFNSDLSGSVIAEALVDGVFAMKGIPLTDPCLTLEPCISKYRQRYAYPIDDVDAANLEPCYASLLKRFDIKANLVVSILVDDETPWGMLAAQHCSSPRHWDEEEVNLLLQLSDQISVAIHQSHLYHQLQCTSRALEQQISDRTHQLHKSIQYEMLVRRITEKVWRTLDEQQIIQPAIQELCDNLSALFGNVSFYPLAADHSASIVGEYFDQAPEFEGFILPFSYFPGLWDQLRRGVPCHFCCILPDMDNRQVCMLLSPMADDSHTLLGDLLLIKEADQAFSEAEIQIVQQVTTQCAIAIRQSRLHNAAQAQVEELARLNQLKDDFLSTVSHELRTPMANIRMATQMLEICLNRLGILDNTDNRVEKYFTILKSEGQREINLIDDLLNLSRLEAGVEELNPILVDLKLWVVHIADAFQDMAQSRGQTIHVNLPEVLPLVYADLSCLERIVTELLANACKYTPADEHIRISASVHAPWLELCITNSGVVIDPTELPHVFKKFYRIPNSDRWKHGGTGLGLALSRKLAEVLGGNLLVASVNNKTTFTLRLPLPDEPSL